jgi:uncharacterized protein
MPVKFTDLFGKQKPVVAMIHTGPSPGMPGFICVDSAVERAAAEADVYIRCGVDGILIENMRDLPSIPNGYSPGPEVAAFMTRFAFAVKKRARQVPVGVSVLGGDCRTALAITLAAGCDFVRTEGWATPVEQGAESPAAGVLRYRQKIGAGRIPVFVDIRGRRQPEPADDPESLAEIARDVAFQQANGLVLTASPSGSLPAADQIAAIRDATSLPLMVAGGIGPNNLRDLFGFVDGFFVGSALKEGGRWNAPVCHRCVEQVIGAAERARTAHQGTLQKN